jgi:ABC-type microcin C transport system permease subunit YejE
LSRARTRAELAPRNEPVRAFISPSPARRVWQRFRKQRLGYWSLIVFVVAFATSLAAPLWSNDKPIVVRYDGHLYFPLFNTYSEITFGGDFPTPADYLDPYVRDRFSKPGRITTTRSTTSRRRPIPLRRRVTTGSAPTTADAICLRASSTVFGCRWSLRWCSR